MRSVVAGGPGLVAVGVGDTGGAAVWTSVDGITWSRVAHDEAVFGGGEMNSVTVGGPGLVAVGSAGVAAVSAGVAAVWTSVDGITWSRVPHDEAVFSTTGNQVMSRVQKMNSVTAGGPGLVAVGWSGVGDFSSVLRDPGSAMVWTSPDGITWSRVAHDEAVFGTADKAQGMTSVAVGGPGLVAVGTERVGQDEAVGVRAAVWTSVDGITWSRVPHDEAVFGAETGQWMWGVTAGGPGLVAIGNERHAAVWKWGD
jgi:hypothetical protein